MTATPDAVTTGPPAGLAGNRNWLLLALSQGVSLIGDFVFDTTVVLWVATIIAKDQTWAPIAVAGVLIAAAVPVLLVGPFAGVFVDRWDRRRTMLATDLIRAVLIAALLAVPVLADRLSTSVQLAALYGIVALASSAAQFFNGARFGLLAQVVAPSDQPRASGIAQTTAAIAAIIGPPIAAPLLISTGVHWALLINSLSFLLSYLALLAVRPGPTLLAHPLAQPAGQRAAGRFRRDLFDGARFFGRSPVLRALLISIGIATFAIGALNTLDVFFVTENLHSNPSALGVLGAAFGLGSVVGALVATAIGSRVDPGRLLWITMALTGVAVLLYSRADSLVKGAVFIGLGGFTVAIVNTAAGPLVLRSAPQHLLGRVISVFSPIQQFAGILGMAVVSYLASTALRGLDMRVAGIHLGRIDAIFAFSGVLILVAGIWVAGPLSRAPTPADTGQPPDSAEPVPTPAESPA